MLHNKSAGCSRRVLWMFLLLLLLCCKSFPSARIFATPPPSPLYYVILYYTLHPFSYVILSDLYLSPKTVILYYTLYPWKDGGTRQRRLNKFAQHHPHAGSQAHTATNTWRHSAAPSSGSSTQSPMHTPLERHPAATPASVLQAHIWQLHPAAEPAPMLQSAHRHRGELK